MNKLKDWIVMAAVIGLVCILAFIVIGDFIIASELKRPIDDGVINLLQMSITGLIGIVAGYLSASGKTDSK